MSLFSFFKEEEAVKKYSSLHDELKQEYPELSEKELVVTGCVAGLLARVAYVDFSLDPKEIENMGKVLSRWNIHPEIHTELITEMAIRHIKEMAGLENHLYVLPLREFLNADEKYKLLESLFVIAASDGVVEGVESEEIRLVCKGLELSNQHFLAARAKVSEYISALK